VWTERTAAKPSHFGPDLAVFGVYSNSIFGERIADQITPEQLKLRMLFQ
jgi:hypothetical protein